MSFAEIPRVQTIYYQDQFLTCQEPELPLAPGAVEIVIKDDCDPESTSQKIFGLYQKLKTYWTNPSQPLAAGSYYLERRDAHSGTTLRQIIPYPHGGLRGILRQIQVTWNLVCPQFAWASHQILGTIDDLKRALQTPPSLQQTAASQGQDAFCNPKRIAAQRIMEGKNINLLCNFKPLSTHDLLITAKEHSVTFDEPTFVEAMSLGQRINADYAKQGFPISYLTMADHKFAGQTVGHAHIHAISVRTVTEELLGIAKVVRKILIDSWLDLFSFSPFKLSDKQLTVKIQEEKTALKTLFDTL